MSDEAPRELSAAYAPPADPDAGENEPSAAVHGDAVASGYRTRRLLVRVLCGLLLVDALLLGLNFGACALLAFVPFTDDQLDALARFSQGLARGHLPFHWVRLLFLAWFLVGSNKNARAFVRASGAANADVSDETAEEDEDEEPYERVPSPILFRYSPASMVWWFVVPILNLYKPYTAVLAVWNASRPVSGNAQNRPVSVIWQWWLAYLLTLLFAIQRGPLGALMGVGSTNYNLLAALQNLSGCAAALLTWRMVLAMHGRQRLRAIELWPVKSQP